MRPLQSIALISVFFFIALSAQAQTAPRQYENDLKPRVIVLTDIFTLREADDTESMVRVLAYADVMEIEALIATGGYNLHENPLEEELWAMVLAYERDLDRLRRRSDQDDFLPIEQERKAQQMGYWPSAEYFYGVIREGQHVGGQERGLEGIGDGKDSPGSDLIIEVVDDPDPRPVYVVVFGGANTLGQALHKVRSERTPAEVAAFVSRLRVHSVIDQDNSGPWIREEFPDLFWLWENYYRSAYKQRDEIFRSFGREHYQNHGNLGEVRPAACVGDGGRHAELRRAVDPRPERLCGAPAVGRLERAVHRHRRAGRPDGTGGVGRAECRPPLVPRLPYRPGGEARLGG